ncbi:DEAD-box ATP-dependent RNA helicase CshA [Lacunisphaera limnophila]|uniref:DEAD-box ATP-dependent RNA helicase RhpA n=1 Tax=Lacunisphaera limnophila TaxID=1838286 RepID=A0A1D8AWT6_9BACT|nr:DEAD/DEAH box helicase [Lacunisphaera limnophila]AOS45323.1 DEAD-box ATP-dependent RNA helicase CshA [Lacunisphaera limnophila]
MEKRPFSELGLSPEILKAVDKMGFEEASPIQTAVIPFGMAGRDVVGQSATGSGKTAAFAIPAIEKVDVSLKKVQVLVLCPTRELAVQVAEEFGKLALFKKGLMEVPIYGGQSYDRQFRALAAGAQVVIGTPGRVMDHMERGTLRLDALKVIVLDEADRMLDMGFRDDIEHVLKSVPEQRQCLFFSATMPHAIQELIKRYTRDPEWIRIESLAQNAPQVEQIYFEVDRRSKIEVLTRLIDLHDFRFGIIFCSTKIMVDELDEHLHARGYSTDRLHGDITQAQRTRVMDKFRRRGFEFLVATDVAARGLDVDDLEVVFNFDLPNDAEDYTHRIGRTGRAGKKGMAFTFVSGREIYKLQGMINYARLKIRRERVPSLDEVEEAKGNVFYEKLRATLEEKKFKSHDQMVDRLLEQGHTSTDIASALIHLMQGDVEEPAKKTAKVRAEHIAANESPAPSAPAPRPAPVRRDPPPAATPAPVAAAPEGPASAAVRPVEAARPPSGDKFAAQKRTYERKPRTGREPGYSVVSFNIGRQHLVTPADLVGKIAGVTRLPANVVGAIDINEDHTLVDVVSEHAELVVTKLAGIRIKNQSLKLAVVPPPAG